jgi:hypothetical protein
MKSKAFGGKAKPKAKSEKRKAKSEKPQVSAKGAGDLSYISCDHRGHNCFSETAPHFAFNT